MESIASSGKPQSGTFMTSALNLKDVHLTLSSRAGEVKILRGVDVEAKAGEAIGIVGPSGSGKTSLLMVIAGLESVTSGKQSWPNFAVIILALSFNPFI
jgi:predicted ABC-type transport system involved in lysophospholipase L1 biosynthesis ATPase subunit